MLGHVEVRQLLLVLLASSAYYLSCSLLRCYHRLLIVASLQHLIRGLPRSVPFQCHNFSITTRSEAVCRRRCASSCCTVHACMPDLQ